MDSHPQGARVEVDGAPAGETPVAVDLGENWFGDTHQLRVTKEGYYADLRDVGKTRSSAWGRPAYPTSLFIRLAPVEKTDHPEPKAP